MIGHLTFAVAYIQWCTKGNIKPMLLPRRQKSYIGYWCVFIFFSNS